METIINRFRLKVLLGTTLALLTPVRPSHANFTFQLLYEFSGADGRGPWAGLVQGSDGNFYGTTEVGGANNKGTVFKITPSGVMSTLWSFSLTDGANPRAGLVQGSDGNFYGTTFFGGNPSLNGNTL